ncbi:MAG: YqfO family protein [Gammaproteobacteria bacterium]|nr:YqfO family protein [Gammaproteobacteria bacterium]MBQ0839960.1 YqfO family protein [Gammaproteobacteria bacterium]
MYKICFYVPESHLQQVKEALFVAGAGRIGNYDHCSWQCLGEGQFRPLAGSQPALGQRGVVESVAEYKVELVCADECIHAALAALKASHPYEEPAFDVVKISDIL